MNTVNANIRLGYQDSTWFTNNASFPLLSGQIVYCSDGADKGKYKIGDGTTQLSALTFYGGVATSYTSSNGITLTGSNFALGGALTGNTNLSGAYTLYMSDASAKFCVGRSNPDRLIEAYSTGLSTMQAYSSSSTSYAGVYSQSNNAAAYIGMVQTSTSYAFTSGLRIADSSYIDSAGVILGIWNANPVGDVVLATGGIATANEKLRFTPTVTKFSGNTINIDSGTASRIMATDASKNVQFLDTTTYPSLTELAYVKGVTSAIQTQLNLQTFTTTHFHGLATIGTTTYHYDKYPSSSGTASGSGVVGATIIPYDCTLTGYALSIAVLGVLGTANTATVSVRVNNTTDITLTSSALFSAATNRYSSSALNTNLNAGDYIEIKVVPNCTPTSATNVTESVTLFFKRR